MMTSHFKQRLHALSMATAAMVGFFMAGQASAVTQTGQWNNTTFSSSGDLTIDFTLAPPNYSVSIDADGFVFGVGDPAPMVLAGTLEGDGSVNINITDDPTFGDLTGTVSDTGTINLMATDIPNPNIFSMSMTGVFTPTTTSGTYRIEFNDPTTRGGAGTEGIDFALGNFATQVPEPTSLALLGLGGLLVARRRKS